MLGMVRSSYYWDWEEAEKDLKLAIELDPNSATAHNMYGRFLGWLDRFEEAIPLVKRAQQLDPLDLGTRISAAQLFSAAHRYDEAIEELETALAVNPNFRMAYDYFPEVYERQGLYENAITAYQKILTEEEVAGLADAYQTLGQEGYWGWMLDYFTEMAKQRYVSSLEFARIYAHLGDKDQAMRWLEEGYEEHEPILYGLNVDPAFDTLRDDPRFHDLRRRMNLAP